ncbi:MAG TPA: hypothetical protein PKK13_13595 [Spirochaetota bacterium]|nr:hypothetical protein [Spirochaetota bacterium]
MSKSIKVIIFVVEAISIFIVFRFFLGFASFVSAIFACLALIVTGIVLSRFKKKSPGIYQTNSDLLSGYNAIRGLIYRTNSDDIRKEGEEVVAVAGKIVSAINKKNIDHNDVNVLQFVDYLDKIKAVLNNYIQLAALDKGASNESTQKTLSLLEVALETFNNYYENMQNEDIQDLNRKINIAQKTMELDNSLRNSEKDL